MSNLGLAWSYLRARPLGTALLVLLLALGIATLGFVSLVDRQIETALQRDTRGIDLVVGAKGSPIQLILAGVFHVDAPPGNIPLAALDRLARDPRVARVVPISLGDSFRGFRIVGTTPAYLDVYGGRLRDGQVWKDKLEAVLGSEVARRTGLAVGERFVGSHGLGEGGPLHDDSVYTVVGTLEPTGSVLDRLVLVDTESVWFVHEGKLDDPEERKVVEGERQVTMLLVRYATPLAAASLPRAIDEETNLQSASPAYESARLFRMIGVGADVVRVLGVVVLVTATLSLFVALYRALSERAYDIAVLRTLGLGRGAIALMLAAEALIVALAGALAGLLLAHALLAALAWWMQEQDSLRIDPAGLSWHELWLVLPAIAAALVASAIPAWRAAHATIAETLARRV